MKNILRTALRAILYPLVWCHQVIQETSDIGLDDNPAGLFDCVRDTGTVRKTAPASKSVSCALFYQTHHI